MVVVDQVVSGNVSKILCLSDYEGSATGSLWCFLRVLGGGGLAVVWPRPFPVSTCQRPFRTVSLLLLDLCWKFGRLITCVKVVIFLNLVCCPLMGASARRYLYVLPV